MRTYFRKTFPAMSSILTQAAQGFAAVTGNNYIVSDMVHSLSELHKHIISERTPFYMAIREHGVESGDKEYCFERCKTLGYPLVIIKIEDDKIGDFNLTLMLTYNWMSGDNNSMRQEFDSL